MKLKALYLKNFRCYENEVKVEFNDLTTLVGRNDIGKSSILEALEIFFNNDAVKIEASDANLRGDGCVEITCDFYELPDELILDSGERTSLVEEYLTIEEDTLRIKKVFDCNKAKIVPLVYIVAKHPDVPEFENLLSLKEKELQKIIKDRGIESPLKGNPIMRKAIWNSFERLNIREKEIEIFKAKEDGKEIWSKINAYLPNFALFQSDRSSLDSDGEVQNPMKMAVQEAISEVQGEINEIQAKVREKAELIANQTLDSLKQIDPKLANKLTPKFTSPSLAKWNSLFSISMDTDEGIALNKRGSGVRRMVLVAFFKAATERMLQKANKKNIIYAIEEPETAQHPHNQRVLIKSFKELSNSSSCQILLTTHSPELAKELPTDGLRFLGRDELGRPVVKKGEAILSEIADALGVFPSDNSKVQLVLCVEGPTDVIAFKCLNKCVREKYPEIVDIVSDGRIMILPTGGSTLMHWVNYKYLSKINCREVHIYDNDVEKYQNSINKINQRKDGSWGTLTKKYEIENYLSPTAIKKIYDIDIDTESEGLPERFALAFWEKTKQGKPMKSGNSKKKLSQVFLKGMTYDLLDEVDPNGEVKGWFDQITQMLH